MNFKRDDGTEFELIPMTKKNGKHQFKVFNGKCGRSVKLACFLLKDDQFKQSRPDLMYREVLLDVDPEVLKDLEGFRNMLANDLLASSKIEEIFDDKGGYAGGITVDYVDTHLERTSFDPLLEERIKHGITASFEKRILEAFTLRTRNC